MHEFVNKVLFFFLSQQLEIFVKEGNHIDFFT